MIKNVKIKLRLERAAHTLTLLKKDKTDNSCAYYFEHLESPRIRAKLCGEKNGGIWVFTVSVDIEQSPFGECDLIETESPVVISIETEDVPEKLCAQYQHKDWWSRPDFLSSYEQVPKRTQSLLVKRQGVFGCFLPMVGDKFKAYLQGGENDSLELRLTAYTGGISRLEEICLLYAEGDDLHRSIAEIWGKACAIKGVPDITRRKYPDMFEYIGWCSWDAVYKEVTEDRIREKAAELKDKSIPVRWLLIDDGWLNTEDNMLCGLEPDKKKFPDGFYNMVKEIKRDTKVDNIGVWHSLGAYWGGVHPNGELAEKYAEYLYRAKSGKLIPHYQPERGFGFWSEWYEYLRGQGIDFVKVDGQSALKNYYRNNEEIGAVAKGTHRSLEAAAELYMNGNLINCMGMAIESILSRPVSGMSRNSDDFVPDDENGFREHTLQNSYNALYHSRMVFCDWDMYWTNHRDAARHGLLRAISGGPVYVSDKIGETIAEEILPLAYHDGRILRADRSALPTVDCIFDSPLSGKNLVLTNTVNGTGVAALFHIGEAEGEQTTYLSAANIYGVEGRSFIIYHWRDGELRGICDRDEAVAISLQKDGYDLLLFIQKRKHVTPIGLTDKYMSYHGIRRISEQPGVSSIALRDGGIFTFHAEVEVTRVTVDDADWTERAVRRSDLYALDLSQINGEVCVRIFYNEKE